MLGFAGTLSEVVHQENVGMYAGLEEVNDEDEVVFGNGGRRNTPGDWRSTWEHYQGDYNKKVQVYLESLPGHLHEEGGRLSVEPLPAGLHQEDGDVYGGTLPGSTDQ